MYEPTRKRWYSPEEFYTQYGRIASGYENFFAGCQIRDPQEGLKAGFLQMQNLQIKLEDLNARVISYYRNRQGPNSFRPITPTFISTYIRTMDERHKLVREARELWNNRKYKEAIEAFGAIIEKEETGYYRDWDTEVILIDCYNLRGSCYRGLALDLNAVAYLRFSIADFTRACKYDQYQLQLISTAAAVNLDLAKKIMSTWDEAGKKVSAKWEFVLYLFKNMN